MELVQVPLPVVHYLEAQHQQQRPVGQQLVAEVGRHDVAAFARR